jgi:hypothetical protein
MSDEAIQILIPQGPRAALVRLVHDRSKERRIAAIEARLAIETDPDRISELEALRQAVTDESVNRFILLHFKRVVIAEESELQRGVSEAEAKQRIRDEVQAHLDQFGNI